MTKSYIGIDVCKKNLDVFVLPEGKYKQFENSDKGTSELLKFVSNFEVALIAMEATGKLEEKCAYDLMEADYDVAVLNPDIIYSFRRSFGTKAKTDYADARLIALYAQMHNPTPTKKLGYEEKQIYLLSMRRDELVEMRVKEKQRLSVKKDKISNKSIENTIKFFDKEIEKIEDAIAKLLEKYPRKQRIYEILNSVPGVGRLVAFSLLANLPELGELSAKKITALAGACPINIESGTMCKSRSIRSSGRKRVRLSLYQAIFSGIQYNSLLKEYYQELLKRNKAKKVAMCACMRKLIILLNTLVKDDRLFDKNYVRRAR